MTKLNGTDLSSLINTLTNTSFFVTRTVPKHASTKTGYRLYDIVFCFIIKWAPKAIFNLVDELKKYAKLVQELGTSVKIR